MYFTSVIRYSPEHGKELPYYKIKESFRDAAGRVHTRLMLTPGYLPDLCGDDIPQIRRGLTYKMEQSGTLPGQQRLFDIDPCAESSRKVRDYVEKFWQQMRDNGKIDAARHSYDEAERKVLRLVDVNTIKHTDAREIGAENVCLQAIRELQLDEFLRRQGWAERKINATLASLIVRTVYSPSEWRERFEDELTKVRNALSTKGGTKSYDKVVERIGRALGKYPSVSKYYQIDYIRSEEKPGNMADIRWQVKISDIQAEERFGTYFLRTNVATLDEKSTWDYYNLIREIETSNRQLKTDLELRPIYHQKDDNSDAHLFFGLLSYWIVNTIRHKLKQHDTVHYWTELKRILSTQKAITTEAVNALGEIIEMRLCSDPTDSAAEIYRQLGYRSKPFKRYTIKPPEPPN